MLSIFLAFFLKYSGRFFWRNLKGNYSRSCSTSSLHCSFELVEGYDGDLCVRAPQGCARETLLAAHGLIHNDQDVHVADLPTNRPFASEPATTTATGSSFTTSSPISSSSGPSRSSALCP
jgi:hypothetical protein